MYGSGNCPTCCCNSTENVEFLNDSLPEPKCTAPPAIYEITFVYTLNDMCHPSIYGDNSNWSRPFAASHSAGYRLWDACMDSVSAGVLHFSKTGDLGGIITEGGPEAVVKKTILDLPVFDGDEIPGGSGRTVINLTLDSFSASMCPPSPR